MNKVDEATDTDFIFGALLVVANKMDTLLDRVLSKYNITSKQWFLLLILFNIFEKPPTIKEAAKEMGSSHQNIKQVALKLEEKGMLRLEKDKKDLRVTRLVVTEKSYEFWKTAENDGIKFMKEFYAGVGNDRLKNARLFISQIMLNLKAMEEKNE
ncbi:transcriptional regulator SlyA [Oxobacter pfennigii]|uniref:Transcriptional regulator SlyA n=1 Tax=Oxobacter pfennigii TaxID=36849 RepID=A0A0N8NTU9_9CLOT|nr:MarR family transcriptional regulator [Oxobacter pfennigii]KPU45840.1 transcriptional regulator SlyA [Oxobacter pfennigii]